MKELPYHNAFAPIPRPLLEMLSGNACKAFGQIYLCVFAKCDDLKSSITIPIAMFSHIGSRNTITNAIEELEKFNVVNILRENHKKTTYRINWIEINAIQDRFDGLNYKGRDAIKTLAIKLKKSISQLSDEDCSEILGNTEFVQKLNESIIRSKNEQTEGFVQNLNEYDHIRSKSERIIIDEIKKLGIRSENEQIFVQDLVEKVICSIFERTLPVPDGFEFLEGATEDVFVQNLNKHSFKNCTNIKLFVQKLNTYNNRENNNKKLSEARSDSYIEGENIFSSSETVEEVDEDSEEEIERRSQERRKRKLEHNKVRSSKSPDNPYEKKPYFSRTVLEEFIDNPELCKDSPVKMYIYNLFKGLSDYCCNIREEQEDDEELPSGEKYIPSFKDLQNTLYPVATINQIAKAAYDDTVGLSQVGEFEDEYGSFQINFTEVPDLDTAHICDWKFTESRQCVQISTSAFRNIEAEDLQDLSDMKEKDSQSNIREAVRNRQYYGYLLLADKKTLTTIEQLQSEFLQTYVVFDEYYHAVGCKNTIGELMETGLTLPWQTFSSFMAKLIEADVEPKQFFGTLTMRDSWLRGMDIKIGSGVFSYYSTQKLNQQLSLNSEVTLERLDECFPVE